MFVVGPSSSAHDFFYHLPKLTTWMRAEDVGDASERNMIDEVYSRALMAAAAIKALPAGDNPYADCSIRVGYDPRNDAPFFVRKVDKGYIYVASPEPITWKFD